MNLAALSLRQYGGSQLRDLCRLVGVDHNTPETLLAELLGSAGDRTLAEPPIWASDVADDHTPIEFSIAFDEDDRRTLRVLGERIAQRPSNSANLQAAREFLDFLSDRFELSLDRFHAVEDLFLPREPQGKFAMWYSLIFRPHSLPSFKIYFNPNVRGEGQASELVEEGLKRLGLNGIYQLVTEHGMRREQLDRFTFFALDLDDQPTSRVKVYISHDAAESKDVERAASAAWGVDSRQVSEFCCLIGGGTGPFTAQPLISSYSFVEGGDRPSNYSLYLPIRGYVNDDESARDRVVHLMKQHDLDPAILDRALTAISPRSLRDGVGLIAHVALRLSSHRSGLTVYLSSEAFGITPPEPRKTGAKALPEPSMAHHPGSQPQGARV
jgi:DMATS type aromatic prenyltransferase